MAVRVDSPFYSRLLSNLPEDVDPVAYLNMYRSASRTSPRRLGQARLIRESTRWRLMRRHQRLHRRRRQHQQQNEGLEPYTMAWLQVQALKAEVRFQNRESGSSKQAGLKFYFSKLWPWSGASRGGNRALSVGEPILDSSSSGPVISQEPATGSKTGQTPS